MRELKFRAWKMHNGKLQRYVFSPLAWSLYADKHLDEPIKFDSTTNDIKNFMPDADVIEQYTGLKDKNGKEIYEGDIIRHIVEDTQNGAITFKDGAFYVEYSDCTDRLTGVTGIYVEIIGNIHENPEILEEEE